MKPSGSRLDLRDHGQPEDGLTIVADPDTMGLPFVGIEVEEGGSTNVVHLDSDAVYELYRWLGELLDPLFDSEDEDDDEEATAILVGAMTGRIAAAKPESFDAFEIATVAEYPDARQEENYFERITSSTDFEQGEEAIGYMVTVFGRLPSGGVDSILDFAIGGIEYPTFEDARLAALEFTQRLAGDRPVYDDTIWRDA